MDTSTEMVAVKPPAAGKRQRRSVAEKRLMVVETLAEGASVARVARGHGVNANQLFYWRRLYQSGRLGGSGAAQLLPVRVRRENRRPTVPREECSTIAVGATESFRPGTIHIDLRQAQVRIEGNADPALLRVLLECLGR
jgi:transposase